MPDIPTFVQNLLKKTTKTSEQWLEKVPAWLGDHDGVVLTSTWGMINVRTVEGQVLMVYNTVAPAERNLMVEIGRSKDTPNLWQVISRRGVYGNVPASSSIQYHHIQHEYPAGDSVFVRRDQFTPLLVLPAGGFNVRLYGDVVYKFGMAAPVKVENADIDLSSYAIDAGAKYVLLEAQDDGTLNYIEGDVVGSRELLELEPLPTPSSNAFPICAFIFYELQTELRRDDEERTIIDLRQFTTDVATDSITQFHAAPEKVTIADDDEIFGADSEDTYSAAKWLWSTIKDAILSLTVALYSALGHTHDFSESDHVHDTAIGHLHGLNRWVADGALTSFELADIAEYLVDVTDNGSQVDMLIYSLSSDGTQLVFDTAPTAAHVIQAECVVANI